MMSSNEAEGSAQMQSINEGTKLEQMASSRLRSGLQCAGGFLYVMWLRYTSVGARMCVG
jgi:hypothetical protein